MSLTDLPVLDALRMKMKWHQARQRVLAENVANADSPDYQAREIKPLKFSSMVRTAEVAGIQTTVTDARHIAAEPTASASQNVKRTDDPDFETSPSGNSVALEEQMMKVAQNQMDYQAATTLYSKSIGLLRMAIGQNNR